MIAKLTERFENVHVLVEDLILRKEAFAASETGLAGSYVDSAMDHLRHAGEKLRLALQLLPEVADKPKDKVQVEFGKPPEKPFWKP